LLKEILYKRKSGLAQFIYKSACKLVKLALTKIIYKNNQMATFF
jgi:hypothetical protein